MSDFNVTIFLVKSVNLLWVDGPRQYDKRSTHNDCRVIWVISVCTQSRGGGRFENLDG